jgi:ABC-2 type transport system ATP-binding protein
MDHAIVVKDVYKSFKDVKAVQGITLDISKGEYVALLGPNGAGKTTLVEMIEGIQKQDSGDIIINGLHWKGNEDQLHRVIGLSLQETNFIDKLKVKETLNLFSSFFSLPDTRADEVLEMVNLAGKSKAFVRIALLNRPEILLLDEPTTGLDPTARREVWDILVDLKKNYNTTMILTTHYMEEASYLCDRIVIMDSGKVLARGTLENLLSDHMAGEIIEFSVNGAITQSDLPDSEQLKSYKQEQASGRWVLVVEDLVEYLPKLQKVIESSGHQMTYLECRKMTLDDLFISMTGRHLDQ